MIQAGVSGICWLQVTPHSSGQLRKQGRVFAPRTGGAGVVPACGGGAQAQGSSFPPPPVLVATTSRGVLQDGHCGHHAMRVVVHGQQRRLCLARASDRAKFHPGPHRTVVVPRRMAGPNSPPHPVLATCGASSELYEEGRMWERNSKSGRRRQTLSRELKAPLGGVTGTSEGRGLMRPPGPSRPLRGPGVRTDPTTNWRV